MFDKFNESKSIMNQQLYAGAAKGIITAHVKSRNEVRDDLFVRTLVVENSSKLVVIMALDAVGIGWICDIPNDFLKNLRAMLKERFDIAPENVLVSATHTHPSAAEQHLKPEELLPRLPYSCFRKLNL